VNGARRGDTVMASGGGGKSWAAALALSIFLGLFGADRFYLGYTGPGVLKLLTCGGCWLWYVFDVVLIALNRLPDAEGRPLT
jgi:TM2 domain-containing membrane protein YozV